MEVLREKKSQEDKAKRDPETWENAPAKFTILIYLKPKKGKSPATQVKSRVCDKSKDLGGRRR